MTLVARSLLAGFLFVTVLTVAADDYRFPTRRAALGEYDSVQVQSVADVIRGQVPSAMPNLTQGNAPAIGTIDGATTRSATPRSDSSRTNAPRSDTPRNDIAESELSMRPPDPVGPVDPESIPEVLKPIPQPAAGKAEEEHGAVAGDVLAGGAASTWNTLLLIVALATGGLAAYAIFAALDYKQRWEHAILAQNDRLLGAFESDDSMALPPAW